jgi:hypothetical protein
MSAYIGSFAKFCMEAANPYRQQAVSFLEKKMEGSASDKSLSMRVQDTALSAILVVGALIAATVALKVFAFAVTCVITLVADLTAALIPIALVVIVAAAVFYPADQGKDSNYHIWEALKKGISSQVA